MYQHSCKGEPKVEDVAKPNEKPEKNDDMELAPPKKFSKLAPHLLTNKRKTAAELAANLQNEAKDRERFALEHEPVDMREQLGAEHVGGFDRMPELLHPPNNLFETLMAQAQRRQKGTKAIAMPEWEPRRIRRYPGVNG